jgi:hypothetical protein
MKFFFKIYPIVILLFTTHYLHSQKSIPATITLNSGEVIQGQIPVLNWLNTSEIKIEMAGGAKKNVPRKDIQSLQITRSDGKNEWYEQHEVWLQQQTPPDIYPMPVMERKLALLRVLFKSDALTLYDYREGSNNDHFLVKKDTVEDLIYRRYMDQQDKPRENNRYRQQLQRLMLDCPEIGTQASAVFLKKRDLRKLAEAYSKCKNQAADFIFQPERNRPEIGVVGAAGIATIRPLVSSAFNGQVTYDFPYTFQPGFGVSMNTYIARTHHRFSIYTEALTRYNTHTAYDTRTFAPDVYDEYTLQIKVWQLRFNAGPRFYLTTAKHRLFINAGPAFAFKLQDKNTEAVTAIQGGFSPVTHKINVLDKNLEFALWGGIGWQFQRLSLEVRGEQTEGFIYRNGAPITSFSLIAGYRINRSSF